MAEDDRRPPQDRIPPEERTDRDPPPEPRDPHGPHADDAREARRVRPQPDQAPGSPVGGSTDTGSGPAHHPPPPADRPLPTSPRDAHGPHAGRPVYSGVSRTVTWIYVLYLVGIFIPLVTVAGAIWAGMERWRATPTEATHYTFQIGTFWGTLAAVVIGSLLSYYFVGYLILLLWAFWIAIRAVKGLSWAGRGDPVPDPQSWLFGGGGASRPDDGRRPPP